MPPTPARLVWAGAVFAAVVAAGCNRARTKTESTEADGDTPGGAKPYVKPVDPDAAFPSAAPPAAAKTASRWGGTAIPFGRNDAVTFGPVGCPVAVVGADVWDLKTYKAIRTLPDKYEERGLRALSPDGKYFAAASRSPNQDRTAVTVWSTDGGKQELDIPGKADIYVDVLAFIHSGHLLVGGRHADYIDAWDVTAQKVVGRLTVPDKKVAADKLAFSPDGRYFAFIGHDKVTVCETATNKQTAVMAPPGDAPGKRATGSDAVFVYAWARGLAFSPDGSELALFSTHSVPRLVVWNARGDITTDAAVPMPQFVSHRNTLEWFPDATGWLVNGSLFDRATKRVVVSVRVPFATDVLPHMLDKDRVIGVYGDDTTRLQTITIPWEKLTDSLAHATAKGDAYLAPGAAVSIELNLTGLRGDEAETRKILTDALTKRLARDGIPVAPGMPTVLRLRLSEQAGDTVPIYERQSPFDRRGSDTGRKATEAKGAAVLELVAAGEAQPLWRGTLNAQSSRSFSEEINDVTVRKSMLDGLANQLNTTDMPYFIPKSKDVVSLPAVVE